MTESNRPPESGTDEASPASTETETTTTTTSPATENDSAATDNGGDTASHGESSEG